MTTPVFTQNTNNPEEKRPKVKLYYVGTQLLSARGKSPTIIAKSRTIQLPEIGRSMTVDAVLAKDIIFQSSQVNPETGQIVRTMLTEEEGGAEIAKALRKAIKDGIDVKEVDIERIKARSLSNSMSDEDIVEMLEHRGVKPPEELLTRIKKQKAESESSDPKKTETKSEKKKDDTAEENDDKSDSGADETERSSRSSKKKTSK